MDELKLLVRDTPHGATIQVRVHPRAKKTAITGIYGAALKISLSSPAVDGRANHALIEFLASRFDVSRGAVTILSGDKSRNKAIRIEGRTAAELTVLLAVELNVDNAV